MLHPTTCPLCGETTARELIAVRDPFVDDETRFPIGTCFGCGLTRTLAQPDEAERVRWYARHFGARHAEAERHGGLLRRLWQRAMRMHPFDIVTRVPRGGSLLEIGCGGGEVLAHLARSHAKALGLEPDEGSARRARARGLEVVQESVESWRSDQRFDHVLFSFVLEHLADPVATLRRAREWLAPGGTLHVFCPDLDSPFRAELGAHWALWHVPYQRVFFTRATLTRMLAQAGLRPFDVRAYSRGGVHAIGETLQAGAGGLVPRSGRVRELAIRMRSLLAAARGRGDCLAVRAHATHSAS